MTPLRVPCATPAAAAELAQLLAEDGVRVLAVEGRFAVVATTNRPGQVWWLATRVSDAGLLPAFDADRWASDTVRGMAQKVTA